MKNYLTKKYKGKRVLITGGLGFIGSNLAIRLLEYGAKITVLDSMIPEHGGNYFNIEPIESDINVNISDMRDPNSLRILIKDQDLISVNYNTRLTTIKISEIRN